MKKTRPDMLASVCVSFSIAATTAFVLLATSVFAEEGPSKEDTIAWLHEKIGGIEVPPSKMKTGRLPSGVEKKEPITHTVDFIEGGTVLRVFTYTGEDHSLCYFREQTTGSLKLSDVTPSVDINNETDYEGYTFVTLRCSSGRCISGFMKQISNCGRGREEDNFPILWSEGGFFVPTTIAGRVQKALSHLISLSGGQEKVSEDLF